MDDVLEMANLRSFPFENTKCTQFKERTDAD